LPCPLDTTLAKAYYAYLNVKDSIISKVSESNKKGNGNDITHTDITSSN
jgi:hypothetical protein